LAWWVGMFTLTLLFITLFSGWRVGQLFYRRS
jgi:hypothetical protein